MNSTEEQPIKPSRFEQLEPRSLIWTSIKWFFGNYVYVDFDWFRILCVSFLPTLFSLLAVIVAHKGLKGGFFLLTPAWARWAYTLSLLNLTWLVVSRLGSALSGEEKNNWLLLHTATWGVCVGALVAVELLLATSSGGGSEDQFVASVVAWISALIVAFSLAASIAIRKAVTKRALFAKQD